MKMQLMLIIILSSSQQWYQNRYYSETCHIYLYRFVTSFTVSNPKPHVASLPSVNFYVIFYFFNHLVVIVAIPSNQFSVMLSFPNLVSLKFDISFIKTPILTTRMVLC